MTKIKAQKPATGILEMKEYPDMKSFRVPCSCGCESEINFSVDVDDSVITSHYYVKTATAYWRNRLDIDYNENWLLLNFKLKFNDIYNRIAVALTAIFKGYVETEAFVLMDKQQTLNFSETLKESIREFDEQVAREKVSRKTV